jgi:MtN3 and saliva related transmembrane protein
MATELVGWISATILLLTLGRQVYTQWRERSAIGVSKWLFIGQCCASVGFLIYSYLVDNWVFVVTNALILLTALVGQAVVTKNRRRDAQDHGEDGKTNGRRSAQVVKVSRREFRSGRSGYRRDVR